MSDTVTLSVGGQRFAGWTSIEVATGIDAVASSFRVGVTERFPGHPDRWVLPAGAPAVVAIGGEPIVTGYIDRLEGSLEAESHTITVSGRSKTGDLVDCSAINQPGSWTGLRLEQIAAELAAPFGITVSAEASTGAPFARFAIQQGESAWDAIERMLKQRGLLAITDVRGNVQIVTPASGAAQLTLTEGRELLTVSGTHDVADRFSRYIAKGQASGDDYANGAAVAGPRGEAADPAVTRYRPYVVMAEDQATATSLTARAHWEAIVRAAKAQEATVTVSGWRQSGSSGSLWQPMQLVRLVAPSAWIEDVVMVVGATFRLDGRGRTTELRLGRPQAYTQLALPEDAKASSIVRQGAKARLGR